MRIGLIRRSHDLNQQRRRASSALNADCATPQTARPRLGSGLVGRRASSVVSDGPPGGGGGGGCGGQDDGSSRGHQLKSRSMTIGGYRGRQQDGEALFFARSNSQDAAGDGRGPTPGQLVRQSTLTAPWWGGDSTDETQTEELCNGKVLSVLAIIFAVLLLTLGFAIAVRYLYR